MRGDGCGDGDRQIMARYLFVCCKDDKPPKMSVEVAGTCSLREKHIVDARGWLLGVNKRYKGTTEQGRLARRAYTSPYELTLTVTKVFVII